MTANTTTVIPFHQLHLSPANVRKQRNPNSIEALAASILAQGLLQNLVVHRDGDGYGVDAGGRRYEALSLLVESAQLPKDFPVSCRVIDADASTAASLAENVQREAMHPADEFDAFQKLTAESWTIDRIADAFGVTPLVVERRLKLTKAAPELIERFRNDELTTDQLIALCATDDHAVQVAVWNRLGRNDWNNKPADLRRAVLAQDVQADRDPRVAFIGGIAAYQAAGGEVRRDLFSGDGQGAILTNPALLDQLVADKLESEAEKLRAEGWGWVEVWAKFDDQQFHRLGHIESEPRDLPEEASQKIEALRAESETLNEEQEAMHAAAEAEDGDLTDEQWERDGEIEDRREAIAQEIASIEEAYAAYNPEAMACAGAIVAFNNGGLRIERGLVKTADRKAVAAAIGKNDAVSGGRETESAGRKPDMSDALRRSLLGHRNLAAQIVTADKPDVAKILLACWTVEHIRSHSRAGWRGGIGGTPSDFRIAGETGGTRTYHPITDETGKAKAEAFAEACAAMVAKLPTADGKLWDALAAMKADELDRIIAYGVALSVSLATDNNGLTGKFLAALGFDMAEHFVPTADNYLGKVSKPLVVEALAEAKKVNGEADKTALLAMKKGALAAEAEKRLAGTGWVPKLIRTPKPKAEKPAAPKAAKATKAKAPAKAATKGKSKAKAPAEAAQTAA